MANSYRNEISLKEVWETLWKGKYMIAGFTIGFIVLGIILSFFVVPTAYEATVHVDPSTYGIGHTELLHEARRVSIVGAVAGEFAEKPSSLHKGSTLESVKDTRYIKIKVVYHDRDAALGAAEKIGLDILQLAREMRQERLFKDKERTERLLAFLEQEPLVDESNSSGDGRQVDRVVYLEIDPVKKMQLEQKAEALARLRSINFELYEVMSHPDYEPENWLLTSPVVGKPVNKTIYIILAAFFGFAFSCFIALIRESWSAETPVAERNSAV